MERIPAELFFFIDKAKKRLPEHFSQAFWQAQTHIYLIQFYFPDVALSLAMALASAALEW